MCESNQSPLRFASRASTAFPNRGQEDCGDAPCNLGDVPGFFDCEGSVQEFLLPVTEPFLDDLVTGERVLPNAQRNVAPVDLCLPADLKAKLEAEGEVVRPNRDGKIQIDREAVAKVLNIFGDQRAKDLLVLDWMGGLSVKARNKSILIHGFRAKTRRDNVADVETLLRRVADFFLEENEKNAERLPCNPCAEQ